jgi:hypothetical protein
VCALIRSYLVIKCDTPLAACTLGFPANDRIVFRKFTDEILTVDTGLAYFAANFPDSQIASPVFVGYI